jgi:hypothetical protein
LVAVEQEAQVDQPQVQTVVIQFFLQSHQLVAVVGLEILHRERLQVVALEGVDVLLFLFPLIVQVAVEIHQTHRHHKETMVAMVLAHLLLTGVVVVAVRPLLGQTEQLDQVQMVVMAEMAVREPHLQSLAPP